MQHTVMDAPPETHVLSIAMQKHWQSKFFFFSKFPQRLKWISVGCFYSNIVSTTREGEKRGGGGIEFLGLQAYMLQEAVPGPKNTNI